MPIFHPFVHRRQADAIPPKYPPHFADTQEVVIVYAQEAPDRPMRGRTPVRAALSRSVNFYFNPTQFSAMGFENEFGAHIFGGAHRQLKQPFENVADYPIAAAKMEAERANIRRPQPITYGSQFEVG